MNNLSLNELLEIAEQGQKEWNEWPESAPHTPLPRGTRKLWDALHTGMIEDLPVSIRLATGGVRQVGSVGALTGNLLLFYSEILHAPYCMEAVDLRLVVSIEKVEGDPQ